LVTINHFRVQVYNSTGSSFSSGTQWNSGFHAGSGWNYNMLRTLADVTGDGKLDLVGINGSGHVRVAPSNGWMFMGTGGQLWYSGGYVHSVAWSDPRDVLQLKDVTGDGKADFVAIDHYNARVLQSTGTSFLEAGVWNEGFDGEAGYNAATPRLFEDMNGDGYMDLIAIGKNAWSFNYSSGYSFEGPVALQYKTD
jgi:hypothetical protein